MELQLGDQCLPGDVLRDLKKTGIAKASLLKECWKKECHSNDEFFRQLCLMLQAYCLIYPIGSSKKAASVPPQPSLSGPLASSSAASPPISRSQSARDADHTSESFLVPCMLPDKQLKDYGLERIAFYFDFCGFLPTEIYHRLVCLMLAKSKEKTEFSATCCRFYNVSGSSWKIEMCSSRHVLKVSVM